MTMVTIEPVDRDQPPPALGAETRFAVQGEVFAAVSFFLEHEGVIYPRPLVSAAIGSIRIYPEAPGRYALVAAWRAVSGASGCARREFHVKGPSSPAPQKVRTHGERLWVPTAWDAHAIGVHEATAVRAVRKILRPGMTVYDVGANVGSYAASFLRQVGGAGWLYAIEPNPVCVSFLRANLGRTGAHNFSILPVALAAAPGDVSFSVNYGSSMIGAGNDRPGTAKPGHHIRVEQERLDTLVARLQLRSPDFIKIDVEGAEASVVAGMMNTLEASRPHLMIELHGRDAAAGALECLAPLGYRYRFPSSETMFTTEALLSALPEMCVQVIGRP